jgi:Protein of unknown function (DUF3014)
LKEHKIMPDRDTADFRPASGSSIWPVAIAIVVLLAAGLGWWYWSSMDKEVSAPPPIASAPQPDVPEVAPPPAPSGPQNPVDALAEPDTKLPSLKDSDAAVTADLNQLVGKKATGSFLQTDGFVRRFVATVDNLPRSQAPARMWPVQPTPSRFAVQGDGEARSIDPDNGARYTPFVLFVESVNTHHAVALYARLYPLFQQAYEELGYPGKYFNDRMVAVLDHLLSTPEPPGPVQVRLMEIKIQGQGDVNFEQPWVHYEFVDPQLEALSAGQKMLIRMGPVNERRLKAKLVDLRHQLASGAVAKK